MKSHYYAGALGMVLIAVTGSLATAGSTATITQDDGRGSTIRKVFRSNDSQTIVQQHGGNRAVFTQGSSRSKTRVLARKDSKEMDSGSASMNVLVNISPELQQELQELAMDESTTVQALVEAAIQDYLDRNY